MPIPRRIIQIWTGEKPPIIQTCQDEIKRYYSDYEYLEITDLEEYLEYDYHPQLTSAVVKKQWDRLANVKRPVSLRCDLIKLLALIKHGGILLDADMFPLRKIEDDIIDTEKRIWGYVNTIGLIGEHIIACEPNDWYITGIAVSFCKSPIRYGVASINLSHWVAEYRLLDEVWPENYTITHYRHCKPEHRYDSSPDAYFSHLWYADYAYDIERLRALQDVCE